MRYKTFAVPILHSIACLLRTLLAPGTFHYAWHIAPCTLHITQCTCFKFRVRISFYKVCCVKRKCFRKTRCLFRKECFRSRSRGWRWGSLLDEARSSPLWSEQTESLAVGADRGGHSWKNGHCVWKEQGGQTRPRQSLF